MTEQGRPWWNTLKVNGSVRSGLKQSSSSKYSTIVPKPGEPPAILVKKEPSNSSPPSSLCKPPKFSPVLFPSVKKSSAMNSVVSAKNSVVKTEPSGIKSEPMAYMERALVKGEFPHDFNWPQIKWEPLVIQNHIKNETKQHHYIPKPLSKMEMKLKYAAPRRRTGPPPDWHYIYTRDIHEPRGASRSWWNTDVERALKNRRNAYLQTKLNDNVPTEVRMERIWAFQVAKDEVRRIVAESKWKAAMHDSGNIQGLDTTLNFGASTSRDTGCVAAGKTLPVRDRLGHLPTVGDIGSRKNENQESPLAEETEDINPDDIQVIPHSQENVEVLTLDDEIEDAMSSSEDDSDNIRIVGELGSDDVIFIQKRQGEVTFLAQVNGRFIKMNRKRKLCVTVSNTLNTKRKKVVNVEDESGNVGDENGEQLTNFMEQTGVSDMDSILASHVTESINLTENMSDRSTSGEGISGSTSDLQINNIQECLMLEAIKKKVLRNENFLDCHNLSVESESVVPFNFSAENASVVEKIGPSGIQLCQEQITADILSDNESSNSVMYDIQEVSVSDDEPKYIDSSTQNITHKEKEAHKNVKLGDAEIVINRIVNDKQGLESLHSKENLIVLEGDICVESESKVMEEKEEEISAQENNPKEVCDLKEGFVDIQCSLTAVKKRKTEESTGEGTCEIGSGVNEEENKNIDKKMVEGASDPDDVLEIDVVEVKIIEKDDISSECEEGYNSVEVCENGGGMFVNKKDDTHCGLKSQINNKQISLKESNSCDVEVVDAFDEEVEIVQESFLLQKKACVQHRISKNVEQGMPNTRQKTGEHSNIRITRQSAISGNGKQDSEKKETKRKLLYNSGVCTRSKRY